MRKVAKTAIGLAILLVMALVLMAGAALAFKNHPQGFRGLKWGDPPSGNMELLQQANEWLSLYTMRDDQLKLDGVNLYMGIYSFYTPLDADKKFMNVSLYFQGERAYELLKTICEERFGDADRGGLGLILWRDYRGIVELDYGVLMKKGTLTLASHKIWTKYLDQKAKTKSKEAEGDW